MIRAVAIVALALMAGQSSAFMAPAVRRAAGALRMATEETPAPAAESEEVAEPEPEPAPALPTKSASLPFMPRPAALDGTLVGDVGFDPLGLSNAVDVRWMREAELKHGRICMLAVVGFIATDLGIHLPGAVHNVGSVAAHDAAVKFGGMSQILLWVSVAEVWSAIAVKEMMLGETDRQPGDFKLDLLGNYAKANDQQKKDLQLKELKNGRLAMIAFGGMVTQAVLTGKPFPF
uniref:Plastid light harvesting protein n=1 Tax=Pinguiococcus pyrenoidosus TaxID=172671 RepID=A0A7R9YG40_9STRA|mmetsp:Transcript_8781/g.33136  ORF Transcript_8781/g.33136 Transcript_8781/m.33136 type:complete len:233 (+) Transcript_8781:91-789(+)